ncbi:MAG: dihydrolipoyl dehydrogenase family protein [Nocardioidaceae bacterium]
MTSSPSPAGGPAPSEADVIVVGMGPGGEHLAGTLASRGLTVIGVENRLVGGECPYWGCIPSKMLIRSANLLAEGCRVEGMAGDVTVAPDFAVPAQRIRDEATDGWDDSVAADRFAGTGGHLLRGEGRLTGPGSIEVDGRAYRARRGIVLNTGTRPATPPIDGLADTPYWTNREILEAEALPESLIVIGGGAVGLELAQAFVRFGTKTTIVEAGPRLLGPEEPESADLLTRVLGGEGITIHTDAGVTRATHDGTEFTLTFGDEQVRAERLLVATGRIPNTDRIGLDSIGVDPGSSVRVDEHQRLADGVWAIGDITGKGAFTHVSMYQADIAIRSILGEDGPGADYRALPRVTFTDPEVGAVGLTERQAREAGLTVRTGTADLAASSRGFIHKAGNDGLVKLVEDADRGVLVGATAAGPSGGEVLGALVVAVRAQVPVADLRHTIYAYPTFHRAIESALADLS